MGMQDAHVLQGSSRLKSKLKDRQWGSGVVGQLISAGHPRQSNNNLLLTTCNSWPPMVRNSVSYFAGIFVFVFIHLFTLFFIFSCMYIILLLFTLHCPVSPSLCLPVSLFLARPLCSFCTPCVCDYLACTGQPADMGSEVIYRKNASMCTFEIFVGPLSLNNVQLQEKLRLTLVSDFISIPFPLSVNSAVIFYSHTTFIIKSI